MRFVSLFLPAAALLALAGCAGTTPIEKLALPPVSAIEGRVTRLDAGGFALADDSGSIYVKARLPGDRSLNLSVDEKVRVYGNLQGGEPRAFDGYVIRRSSGEQIIVSNPSPHLGFIIQTSFK